MLCPKCDNILQKKTEGKGKYYCISCGAEYPLREEDTKIHENDKKEEVVVQKSGFNIYNYPCYPKEFGKCVTPNCQATIIAFERDKNGKKIYGCGICGCSWTRT